MASNAQVVQKLPFKMYPLNKSSSGKYSYAKASPILTFEFAENNQRMLKSDSLYVCGRLKIFNKNKSNLPANRFDLAPEQTDGVKAFEEVAYIDDRIGCNALIDQVGVYDLRGSLYEQAKNYHRNMSSIVGATNSYKHLCSYSQMNFTSCPNNDVMAREVCSELEFALPLSNGYFRSNPRIDLLNGLSIKLNLTADAQVLYGLNGSNYEYEVSNVFLMGDYLVSAKPVKESAPSYVSYHNYQNTLHSGNDHQNINLALSAVNSIYQNFQPSAWSNNYNFNSFCTPPLLQKSGDDYIVANMNRYTINRGAIRYPLMYAVDETYQNKKGAYQTTRSREYLNSIVPYSMNRSCLLSPDTEARDDMVEKRTNWLKTNQGPDQGLVPQWQKAENGGVYSWVRNGNVEKASNVYGIGTQYDNLHIRQFTNFQNASYNYSLESDIDNTPNNTYVFCTAVTKLKSAGKAGQVMAVN